MQSTMRQCSCASASEQQAAVREEGLKKKNQQQQEEEFPAGRATVAAISFCLIIGAALLTWWALRFRHPSYAQQPWMVPVGLVLACTPVVVGVALHFSTPNDDTPPVSAVIVDVV